MKNLSFLALTVMGGAAVFACDTASEEEPLATTTNTTTSTTGAGPTTTGAGTTTATVGSTTTTASATTGAGSVTTTTGTTTSTTGGASTTGTATTTTGTGGATATATTSTGETTTSTTGGDSCVGTGPATAEVPITPADGWVDCATNSIGLQGSFFTYSDGTSTVTPEDFSAAGAEICVTGMAAASGTDIWGAGVGFNLNQDAGSDTANEWDATAAAITGISFNISALPAGGLVRLIYASGGTDYCVEITATGAQTVLFSATAEECWAETPGGAPAETTLQAVKWQVAAVTDAYSFDFCISDIKAVP